VGCSHVVAPDQQRKAAQGDARQDGRTTRGLDRPNRITEEDDTRYGSHERFEVDEGPGDLGPHPALAVGEEGEGQQRPPGRQDQGGQQSTGVRRSRRSLRGGEGHHGQGRAQKLDGRDRDRVAAAQQPRLPHRERGRQQQGGEHQAVAGERGTPAAAARDQAHSGQGHGEPQPGHRTGHAVLPERGDDRDQHGHGADQQSCVGDAGPGDTGVLHGDRAAVTEGAGQQHERAAGGAHVGARSGQQEDQGGEPEARDREPARRQPLQGQLGKRDGGAPQQAGSDERGDGATLLGVHVVIIMTTYEKFASWPS